jgi:signal transduction histidine kinase
MKILHLEDNLHDAELTHVTFLAEWPDCQVKVVDNRPDFLGQLAVGNYDLILSDFNLVNFNGLEALRLAREQAPDVPFVFLSGTIGEDRAIEALQSGAADYVIKDRPKRLIPALRRALQDAERVRERRVAEEQRLRVQRLESVGMLAAGIAHDFNNVLAPVLMGVALLRMRHAGETDQRVLANMESSVTRGTGLVKQILGFAHGVTGDPQFIQPRHLIRDLVAIMHQTFPKTIRIQDETEGALWPMMVNPTQFHQVLLNLCVNARDAMPQGGVLTLRATNRSLDEGSAAPFPGIKAGDYLRLEVSDTGTGIPAAILEKIWEPFFTTKEKGHGTGLGLATVRGIVKEHGGSITLQSRPGQGTTFQVLLPATRGSESTPGAAAAAARPRGQGELLLVVDDDASVREVTGATLSAHGYRVQSAADGTEAVALFAMRSLEFRIVITDLDMPNLNGAALTKVVSALNPAIRVLLVSGSTNVSDPRRQPPSSGRFLSKPFTADALLGVVHELLTSDATPA